MDFERRFNEHNKFFFENGYPLRLKPAFDRLFPSSCPGFRKNLFELIGEIISDWHEGQKIADAFRSEK